MSAEIKNIALDRIFPNPHRDIENYPIKEDKVEALVRSITNGDVGVWPRVIARPAKGGFEMAFGHHLLEAARKAELTRIPLIIMDLDDERMLQYMGRENGEDFGTDFMVLLNTWEAAVKFLAKDPLQNVEPIDVARVLGWIDVYDSVGREMMTPAALACNAAFGLITGGHMKRSEFDGLSVETARNIAQRAMSLMATIDKAAAKSKETAANTTWRKNQVGKAAKSTAKGVREGKVARKDVRKTLDTKAFASVNSKPIPKPLFDRFAYSLCKNIDGMVGHDGAAERLTEIERSLANVTLDADRAALSAVRGSLGALGKRAGSWHARLGVGGKEVQPGATPLLSKRGE